MRSVMCVVMLAIASAAGAQEPLEIKPWVDESALRHLYVISGAPFQIKVEGKDRVAYAVLKYSQCKGTVEWIGGRIFRWKDTQGRGHVYHGTNTDQGMILENPLPLISGEGAYEGWLFVTPPFRGVLVAPPKQPKAVPASPPQVLETSNGFVPSLYYKR